MVEFCMDKQLEGHKNYEVCQWHKSKCIDNNEGDVSSPANIIKCYSNTDYPNTSEE